MKYIKNIIFGLLVLLIILVAIDIGTGIWYWNKLNLKFDSTEFNNIATPVTSIISFAVVFFALFVSIKQNKINVSLSIKPYFERKIDLLLAEAENTKLDDAIAANLFPEDNYNGINYVDSIVKATKLLERSDQFRDDFRDFENTAVPKSMEYYQARDYYKVVFFLTQFTMGFNMFGSSKAKIQNLFTEIKTSKLISEDKDFLQRRIKAEILQKYLSFIENEKKFRIHHYKFPILYERQNPITYKFFYETEFADLYNWLKKNSA